MSDSHTISRKNEKKVLIEDIECCGKDMGKDYHAKEKINTDNVIRLGHVYYFGDRRARGRTWRAY